MLVFVDAQVICIACNNWDSLGGWFDAIENHNDCKPCGEIAERLRRQNRQNISQSLSQICSGSQSLRCKALAAAIRAFAARLPADENPRWWNVQLQLRLSADDRRRPPM